MIHVIANAIAASAASEKKANALHVGR